jgi:cellulose biosynthesis protein BcsQ
MRTIPEPADPLRIGVGHRKGGTSKTTSAVYLAFAIALTFPHRQVWLIDGDTTNDSASLWLRGAHDKWVQRAEGAREFPPNLHWARWDPEGGRLREFIAATVPADADMVMDTGPDNQGSLSDAMRRCDTFIVPMRPSPMEVASLAATFEIANEVSKERPFNTLILLAQVIWNSLLLPSIRDGLTKSGIPVFSTEVRAGVHYVESFQHVPAVLGSYYFLMQEIIAMGDTK